MRFSRVGWLGKGYSVRHVDAFLRTARRLIESPDGRGMAPEKVREVHFPWVRNGYDYRQVDAALDRLELQALERERAVYRYDADPAEEDAEVARLMRLLKARPGHRFSHAARLGRGYAIGEVDAFCDRLVGTLQGGRGPGLRAVRQAEFHSQLGGYSERDVDDFLDQVVDVLLRRLVRP